MAIDGKDLATTDEVEGAQLSASSGDERETMADDKMISPSAVYPASFGSANDSPADARVGPVAYRLYRRRYVGLVALVRTCFMNASKSC